MIDSVFAANSAVPLDIERDGALLCKGAVATCLSALREAVEPLERDKAGVRVFTAGALRPHLANNGCIGRLASEALGLDAQPVRALLFDKSATANWQLGWHQDRTIHVRARHDVVDYDIWTVKDGHTHVEPPVALLRSMLTLRVHLDDVPWDNAPLLIAPGTHRIGLVPDRMVDQVANDAGPVACTAEAGDVWLYSTLILHASKRAEAPRHRRVLQLDYAACDLPTPLEWAGL